MSQINGGRLLADLRRSSRRVSRATVYRTLSKLVDAGLLRKIEIGQRTVYDHDYGYPWHEHLVCDKCGKLTEFTHEGITEAVKGVAAAHGFHLTGYDLVVNGTCADCAAAAAGSSPHSIQSVGVLAQPLRLSHRAVSEHRCRCPSRYRE